MIKTIILGLLITTTAASAAHRERSQAPTMTKLESEVAAPRRELSDVRAQVRRSPWEGVDVPFLDLATLPDLRLPGQPAAVSAPPAASQEREVAEARAYLVATATPGATMARQGPEVALGRLHPALAVRLAEAIRAARANGLSRAGVFSAYRPPSYSVGGFRDKFSSLHSYGLAVDVTGIGAAGSRWARVWERCARAVGLYVPYGPNSRSEFNHTQLVPIRVAGRALRATITAAAPRDLRAMWLASGVGDRVPVPQPVSSARLLPANELAP